LLETISFKMSAFAESAEEPEQVKRAEGRQATHFPPHKGKNVFYTPAAGKETFMGPRSS